MRAQGPPHDTVPHHVEMGLREHHVPRAEPQLLPHVAPPHQQPARPSVVNAESLRAFYQQQLERKPRSQSGSPSGTSKSFKKSLV